MACNAFARTADSGVLRGTFDGTLTGVKQTANVSDMLLVTVAGALLYEGDQVIAGLNADILAKLAAHKLGGSYQLLKPRGLLLPAASAAPPTDPAKLQDYCTRTTNSLLAYKGRPLYGVWATAPYLHNGSVATLWDLMLPPSQRPTDFWTGSREFNPKEVGLVTDPGGDNSFHFTVNDAAGHEIPGNSNRGHDYNNVGLSDHDRWAIIAYIKAGLPNDPLP